MVIDEGFYKVKIKITTPKGNAKGTLILLNTLFNFSTGGTFNKYCNEEDTMIILEFSGNYKQYSKVLQRISVFQKLPSAILENKQALWLINVRFPECTKEDINKIKDMFENGTTIERMNTEELNKIIEIKDNEKKTFWETIKDKFRKVE